MPGIAGWMAALRSAPEDSAILEVLEALAHRGAGAGACALQGTDQRIVLGQRGRPPTCHEASGVAAVLDGDIDNAAELRAELGAQGSTQGSESDLLLHAYRRWDKDFVRRLRGSFALALWDARRERLLLARDRFGERPLYLCETNGSVFFASEVKALLRIPGIRARVDLQAVREYLAYAYVPGPRTLFHGIRKLAPASCEWWQQSRRRESRYWMPADRESRAAPSAPPAPMASLVAHLDAAVGLQVGAQGECGALISGGMNSASVVALMSRRMQKVKTFAVGFAGARESDLPHAARVAQHLGAEHHELVLPRRTLVTDLCRLIACRDAPLAGPEDVALDLLFREASGSVRRVLTGAGAEQLLGGKARHRRERFGWPLVRGDCRLRYVRSAGGLAWELCERLAAPVLNGAPVLDRKVPFDAAPGASRLRRMLYFEQVRLLPDHILERGERIGAAASVTVRAPFLDHPLVEYVSALPDHVRMRGLRGSWLQPRAGPELIPKRLASGGPGLRSGAQAWLRDELGTLALDHLQGPSSVTRAYYRAPVLDQMLTEQLKGRQDHQQSLWMLLNLEIWHRKYRPG